MDTDTSTYRLLSLIALSGECSPDVLNRFGISPSYRAKLITRLKEENYIKTHYKDRLRGYRLTAKAKKLLLADNPDRFSFYLSGNCETNRPRSELPRRLRLQQSSLVYLLLLHAGITVFRDEKPPLFADGNHAAHQIALPAFYHSREIKELGAETVKINNSRLTGILLASQNIFALFYTGDGLLKWEYRTELRVKALLSYHASRGILSHGLLTPWYHANTPIRALLIGTSMDTAYKLLTSTGGYQKCYFYLDGSFDYFHFIPDSAAGETLLRLLCSPPLLAGLRELLLSDLQPPDHNLGLEHDAVSDGFPVLLAFDFEMLRISRFRTALSFQSLTGILICFDFQKDVLERYFGDLVHITTIDLTKFERRYLS